MKVETKKACGYFSEYLDVRMAFDALTAERKKQLRIISALRGRDVLVYAARLTARDLPNLIVYDDLMAIQDQLLGLKGTALDLILETPGGIGEVAEDIVRIIRARFQSVAVIVPGYAKSAGTMIALSGDEILMGRLSALGPIDAQISYQGKTFSAHALLEGFKKIKDEVINASGKLNSAYIPMLQVISPGELQEAENAQAFSKKLVMDWLEKYKFKDWTTHSSTGNSVTIAEKQKRAKEIAEALCDHSRWLTHGRSIKLEDLLQLGVKITDYTADPKLAEAIDRYYTLMQMTFEVTSIYKIIETPESQIYRLSKLQGVTQTPVMDKKGKSGKVIVDMTCGQCGQHIKIQGDIGQPQKLDAEHIRFPKDNKVTCPKCGKQIDLSGVRRQLEVEAGRPII